MALRSRFEKDFDVWLILVLASLCAALVFLVEAHPVRQVLGLAFVLFFPGYALVAALWAEKGALDTLERFALALGLSIAVVVLLGLALAYPGSVGLTETTSTLSLYAFTVTLSALAIYRRHALAENAFCCSFAKLAASLKAFAPDKTTLAITVFIFALAGAVFGYILLAKPVEQYTEFYYLDESRGLANLSARVPANERFAMFVVVHSHEGRLTNYAVEVLLHNTTSNVTTQLYNYSFSLRDDAREERLLEFCIREKGTYKLQFFLYKDGSREDPYLALHRWVDIY